VLPGRRPPRAAPSLRRRDFERARVSGLRHSSRFFIALLVRHGPEQPGRLGITVTRKVGKAVRRNRIKRLVREWYRLRRADLSGCDLVVIAKTSIPSEVRCPEVSLDLDAAWARLRRLGAR
jgi:ribonuclease P protein component